MQVTSAHYAREALERFKPDEDHGDSSSSESEFESQQQSEEQSSYTSGGSGHHDLQHSSQPKDYSSFGSVSGRESSPSSDELSPTPTRPKRQQQQRQLRPRPRPKTSPSPRRRGQRCVQKRRDSSSADGSDSDYVQKPPRFSTRRGRSCGKICAMFGTMKSFQNSRVPLLKRSDSVEQRKSSRLSHCQIGFDCITRTVAVLVWRMGVRGRVRLFSAKAVQVPTIRRVWEAEDFEQGQRLQRGHHDTSSPP